MKKTYLEYTQENGPSIIDFETYIISEILILIPLFLTVHFPFFLLLSGFLFPSLQKKYQHENNDCRSQIAKYRISGKRCLITTQLAGNHRRRSGRRAYETNYHLLGQQRMAETWCEVQEQGYRQARQQLEQHQPNMPAGYAHVARIYLAERSEQHDEQHGGHKELCRFQRGRLYRGKQPDIVERKKPKHATRHAHWQSPVFKKSNKR